MTIVDVMNYCNNYFEKAYGIYKITISADSNNTIAIDKNIGDRYFKIGAYIKIMGSDVNDGIYKITNLGGTNVTLEDELNPEITDNVHIIVLSPPKDFLDVVKDVIAENAKYGEVDTTKKSERIDNYSYTNNDNLSILAGFDSRLNTYRKIAEGDKFEFKRFLPKI